MSCRTTWSIVTSILAHTSKSASVKEGGICSRATGSTYRELPPFPSDEI